MFPPNNHHLNNKNFFYENAITKPPLRENIVDEPLLKDGIKYLRYVIDSFTRDTNLYPSPSQYQIYLGDEITDIIEVELINIVLPQTKPPVINKNFNTINFTINSNNYIAQLNTGNYDADDLATQISSSINNTSSNTINMSINYNSNQNNFSFSNTQPFTLDFSSNVGKNNLSYLLGFPQCVVASDENNVLNSPYMYNPCYSDYAVMYISMMDVNKSDWNVFNKSFAIIGFDDRYNINMGQIPKKILNPPIPRLDKLKISFYDKYGNLICFDGNQNHRFELLIKTSKINMKYTKHF